MKILFFVDGLRAGGKERQLVALIKGLVNTGGYEISVATMNEDVHYKEIFDLDVEVRYFIRKSKSDLSVLKTFYKYVTQLKPDIIHVWDTLTALYALPAAKLQGIKMINGCIRHAAKPRPLRKAWFITKLTFNLSNRVVSNSMAGLTANNLTPSTKNRCIVNGFDPLRIGKIIPENEIRQRFNVTTPHVVGMVAGFENRKDYIGFVEAAQRIVAERDDVTFMAVGDGKNYEDIKNRVKEEYKDRVKLVGRQRDVESIVNIFNVGVLVNNTRGHGEGISNSIMEYMAVAKPVIASDSGGNNELVSENETGFIIAPFDTDALVDRIRHLLNHPERARKMGEKGKQRIQSEFSFEKMIDTYIDLYQELVVS